jgi:hypothetical protein
MKSTFVEEYPHRVGLLMSEVAQLDDINSHARGDECGRSSR